MRQLIKKFQGKQAGQDQAPAINRDRMDSESPDEIPDSREPARNGKNCNTAVYQEDGWSSSEKKVFLEHHEPFSSLRESI